MVHKIKNYGSKFLLLLISSNIGRVVCNVCVCKMYRMMPFYSPFNEGSHQVIDIILPHKDFMV